MDKSKSSFNTAKGVLKILRRGGGLKFEGKCCVVTHRAADCLLGLFTPHVLRAYCNFESKQANSITLFGRGPNKMESLNTARK